MNIYPIKDAKTLRAIARFWSLVDVPSRGLHDCWTWRGTTARGYGKFSIDNRQRLAHRVSWWLAYGKFTEGLVLDHVCRNRACVNPYHLREVTIKENTMAPGSRSISVLNKAKTHCPRGHELAGQNVRRGVKNKIPFRRCVLCTREQAQARWNKARKTAEIQNCNNCAGLEWAEGETDAGYCCNLRDYFKKGDARDNEKKHLKQLENEAYRNKPKMCFVAREARQKVRELLEAKG